MRIFLALLVTAALLGGVGPQARAASGPGSSGSKPTRSPFVKTTSKGLRITVLKRTPPTYPEEAVYRGVQGCVLIGFRLDAEGRPTHLQSLASYPNGVFDEAAVRTIAKWRFRATDEQGHPATLSKPNFIGQIIQFLIHGKRNGVAGWICHQPTPRTLVASPAPATAGIHISTEQHKQWVDMVSVPDPNHEPLTNGWVDIKFCVNAKGHVADARVKRSSPEGLYDRAALAALRSWFFSARHRKRDTVTPLFRNRVEFSTPRFINGKPVKTCGLSYRIAVIGAANLARGPAGVNQRLTAIPIRDLGLPKGRVPRKGRVTLRFFIDRDGSVSGTRIVNSHPRGVFDKAAERMLHIWDYWPMTMKGKGVRSCGVRETVVFKLGRGHLVWAYPASS